MNKVSKMVGSWGVVCAMIAAGLFLAGCGGGPQFAELPGVGAPARGGSAMTPGQTATGNTVASDAPAEIDMIHAGDTLTISFSDLPYQQPPITDRVKEDGTLTLLQNQTFVAAGKTRGQLEKEIRKTYVPAFFAAMTVSVQFDAQHQFYTITGEVKSPGRQIYLSRITLLRAIGSAGDFTDFANKRAVQLTRADGRIFQINAKKALKDPKLDLEIFPGDVINVPRRVNPIW